MISFDIDLKGAAANSPDRPHIISGATNLDGSGVARRVEVRDRRFGTYIISCVSEDDGSFEFTNMPEQILRNPYYVICFDDRESEYGNALIFDRVYQVDDDGNPPQT